MTFITGSPQWEPWSFSDMDIVITFLLILLLTTYSIKAFVNKYHLESESYLWGMFVVHLLMTSVYMIYAAQTTSDSIAYHQKAATSPSWLELWGIGTPFIHFVAWPFTTLLGLSYYATMIVFSFFGYLANVIFYVTAKENIRLQPVWANLSAIELVFLLPIIHFWSSSLGKGSVIMLGLAIFTYGLSRFNRRFVALFFGGLIVFMVRPHIMFTAILSIMLGLVLTSSGIKPALRWLIFILAAVVFIYISDEVLKFTETESLDITSSSVLSHRAEELGKSTTGVNLKDYGLFMRMFTFWFRPLFFDGLGLLGLIVSFENLLYLYMFFMVIREGILTWKQWNGWFRICLFFFIFGSFALAQVTGNLGIAMRQKAQLMPFFFIIYCKAISYGQYYGSRSVRMLRRA